ncbi:hypothetical protein P8C59_008407 [Phyllachora maydis]|uniref:Uncharacterized protein n=1 Tax=Phyllachora maydis TaxID=1825666 RepID=A0AAD9IC54_9PEZI|nr:hypothetical protein P8C59_008407 [Phyllachora maydis]
MRHPTPNLNTRSGACKGNIAALETSAERLSMTSSIEEAIRREHDELKRSDSRRSSLLRARVGSDSSASSMTGQGASTPLLTPSRQRSIIGTNTAARSGGYSPAAYVMSPAHSMSEASVRLRSASKTSSVGLPSPLVSRKRGSTNATADMDMATADMGAHADVSPISTPSASWRNLRQGSVRSVRSTVSSSTVSSAVSPVSAQLSLAEIAEFEPTALTQTALDEADRLTAHGEQQEVDAAIRAKAHQHVDPEFLEAGHVGPSPSQTSHVHVLSAAGMDYFHPPSPTLQIHDPEKSVHQTAKQGEEERHRPTVAEFEHVFTDFDGSHCDPDDSKHIHMADGAEGLLVEERAVSRADEQTGTTEMNSLLEPAPRPRPNIPVSRLQSHLDPTTGQQMLYYPAPVPTRLNLPAKLSKGPRNSHGNGHASVVAQRQSHAPVHESWLPDSLVGLSEFTGSPFMTGAVPGQPNQEDPGHSSSSSTSSTRVTQTSELRRPAKMKGEQRHTRDLAAFQHLPAPLRASDFYHLPLVDQPGVQMQDGSATRTLDSILDASAAAPVGAFTDHVFAGKLGPEVYGPSMKRKNVDTDTAEQPEPRPQTGPKKLVKRNSVELLGSASAQNARKRANFLSLLGRKVAVDGDDDGGRGMPIAATENSGVRQALDSGDEEDDAALGESEPEEREEDSESEQDGEEAHFAGTPTTLLSELELRKQRQKMRTRPVHPAHSNGLHSTLLELDAVHEQQQRDRKGKRITLAWEHPDANADQAESDDEEVPLAMLMAAKARASRGEVHCGSAINLNAAWDEVNRPPGLMERREWEDNEPLSKRRDRLQGRDADPRLKNLATLQARLSTLHLANPKSLGPAVFNARSQSSLTLPLHRGTNLGTSTLEAGDEEPEVEGETLAARKQRLAAKNPLPRARPVSGAFSSELLRQFPAPAGHEQASGTSHGAGQTAAENPVPEDDETLDQRRRRLQVDREARERELRPPAAKTGAPQPSGRTLASLSPDTAVPDAARRLTKRLSMADILRAHPLDPPPPPGAVDPRAHRGVWNHGSSGAASGMGAMRMADAGTGYGVQYGAVTNPALCGGGYAGPFHLPMGAAGMTMNTGRAGFAMPGPVVPPGHLDTVEMWRQNVHP